MDTANLPSPIAPARLAAAIGRPDAPILLDVRPPARFDASDSMLAGAQRCAPDDLPAWIASRPPGRVVTYCVHGHEVGRGAAATLAGSGWQAAWLLGGFEGDPPGDPGTAPGRTPLRMRKRPDLGVDGSARPSRWVTRAGPQVDRVACPWLIRRFIDPRAEFFFVPAQEVQQQAQRMDAIPFDVPGVALGHVWERCTLDALIDAFGLDSPALGRLATIVRAADTDRTSLAPQAAGLLALSQGLSRRHDGDDLAMLAAAMPMYDALFEWCDAGAAERHTWRSHEVAAP